MKEKVIRYRAKMNPKFILLNVIVPLIVAVFAGIAVLHYTNWFSGEKNLVLTHGATSPLEYDAEVMNVETFEIHNLLGRSTENVVLELEGFTDQSEVRAKVILGLQRDLAITKIDETVRSIQLGTLRANESLVVQVFSRSDIAMPVQPRLFSDDVVGVVRSRGEANEDQNFFDFGKLVTSLIFGAIALLASRRLNLQQYSRNNSGFALLHSGSAELATEIFEGLVSEGRAGAFELSNFAFCCALRGDYDRALQCLKAAEIISGDPQHTNILINRALVYHLMNEVEKCRAEISKLGFYGKRRLRHYATFSPYIRDVAAA